VFFENITVKQTDNDAWFEEKVDEMMTLKAGRLDTSLVEKEIDEKIFDHYGLTDSERAVIVDNTGAVAFSEDSISVMSF
jgi:spore coat polysaccharide biosynthesis predicted glycosyltransferase SpsG